MNLPDPAVDALTFLAALILTSLLDVGLVNFLQQAKSPRPHNRIRLTNEFLAKQQLAYPIWYISVIMVADLHKLSSHEALVARSWMLLAILLGFFFWFVGLNGVIGQDDVIVGDHACEGPQCSKLSPATGFLVLVLNVTLAVVALAIALVFIQQPSVVHSLTKTP
jgi:hypothetical protein